MSRTRIPDRGSRQPTGKSRRRRGDSYAVGLSRRGPRRLMGLGVWVLGLAMLGSGCAKARAEMVADGPPLEVPAPPERVIAAIDDTLAATPQPVEPPTGLRPASPAPQNRRQQPPRAENDGREPTAAPAPVAAAPAPAPTPEAPRELRPAGSAADAEAEKKVRAVMIRAEQSLTKVDYRTLSVDNRAQYDEAKRFVQRAEDAIKDRNFVFAETWADKAVTLAAQLIGR